ncbi:MAG: hypothetical protein IPL53_14145 [Ignavibacteria bacterium]|nr:hypothetical protein [Ignavibacteria bacterium]
MTNSVTALCQNNINDERIEKLSLDIGSSDYVFAIIQDNDGFLWFATALGLIKYDGYKFSKAKYENGEDFTQIAFNSFCLDKEGILWVGGQKRYTFKI